MFAVVAMIIAFLVISGGALLFCNFLKINIAEGMILSICTLVALIFLSGRIYGSLTPGKILYILLSLTGFGTTIFGVAKKRFDTSLARSLYGPVLFAVFLISILMYAGDFIQYIDDFHMWAAAPKYMLEYNRLPVYDDFIGGTNHHIGTSVFHYFFQSFTGLNEGMMFVSSSLLFWAGLLFPLGNLDRRYLKETLLFAAVVYFSLFTFYFYGTKNLMVDLPTAGWAGGLAGGIIKRRKKWQNFIIYGAVLFMIYSFKDWAGLLLGVFLLGIIVIRKFLFENDKVSESLISTVEKALIAVFGVSLALSGAFFSLLERNVFLEIIPGSFRNALINTGYTPDKAYRTITNFLLRVTGRGLAESKSYLVITFIEGLVICLLVVFLYGYACGHRRESRIYIIYMLICALIYAEVVLLGFIFRISYYEAIRTSGGARYLSIFIIFYFVFALSLLLLSDRPLLSKSKIPAITGLVLLALFVYGISDRFLADSTAWDQKNVSNYYTIKEQREQADLIKRLIGTKKKVYFINQKSEKLDEFGHNPALFYMGSQMSNPLLVPWKFTQDGAYVRLDSFPYYRLNVFSDFLSEDKYDYLWIYKTNEFLNRNLPLFFEISGKTGTGSRDETKKGSDEDEDEDNPASILDGQLYKVIYNDSGQAAGLKLMKNLKIYDSRAEHEAMK